jgi:hypothetical protein
MSSPLELAKKALKLESKILTDVESYHYFIQANGATIARALVEACEMLARSKRSHQSFGNELAGPCEKIERGWDSGACNCGADAWNARIDAITKT